MKYANRALHLLAPGFFLLGQAAAATHTVVVLNNAYQPANLIIKVGNTVRWVNREKRTSHSVLFLASTQSPAKESERFFPEEHWERTFTKAGSYPYICGPHPEMKGLIHVSE